MILLDIFFLPTPIAKSIIELLRKTGKLNELSFLSLKELINGSDSAFKAVRIHNILSKERKPYDLLFGLILFFPRSFPFPRKL